MAFFLGVVFTWGWEGDRHGVPPGTSRVEVSLIPDGDGTIVRVTHRDLPPETRKPHGEGWQHYLARLATVAAGGDPGPDPWAFFGVAQARRTAAAVPGARLVLYRGAGHFLPEERPAELAADIARLLEG